MSKWHIIGWVIGLIVAIIIGKCLPWDLHGLMYVAIGFIVTTLFMNLLPWLIDIIWSDK